MCRSYLEICIAFCIVQYVQLVIIDTMKKRLFQLVQFADYSIDIFWLDVGQYHVVLLASNRSIDIFWLDVGQYHVVLLG